MATDLAGRLAYRDVGGNISAPTAKVFLIVAAVTAVSFLISTDLGLLSLIAGPGYLGYFLYAAQKKFEPAKAARRKAWERLFYCGRCDVVWDSTRAPVAPESLTSLLPAIPSWAEVA